MNSLITNASNTEITALFAEAIRTNDFEQLGSLMADYKALQRPDGDVLKAALAPLGAFLMNGEAEALEAHGDERQRIGLLLEWAMLLNNRKDMTSPFQKVSLPPHIINAWSAIATYFIERQDFAGFKVLVSVVRISLDNDADYGDPEEMEKAQKAMLSHFPMPAKDAE